MPELGAIQRTLTDDDFILKNVSAERLDKERLTRASCDFDLVSVTAERRKRTNYRTIQIVIDQAAEGPNGYGDVRMDARQSRWMSGANNNFVATIVKRRLLAVRDAPVKIKGSLDPRDEVSLGSLVDLATRRVVGADGQPQTVRHRVTRIIDQGGQFDIETRSTNFGARYAFICPNGYPNYPGATADQRRRAFIAQNTGVMSDGTSAYLII